MARSLAVFLAFCLLSRCLSQPALPPQQQEQRPPQNPQQEQQPQQQQQQQQQQQPQLQAERVRGMDLGGLGRNDFSNEDEAFDHPVIGDHFSDKGPSADVIHDLHAKYETAVNRARQAAEEAKIYAERALKEQDKDEHSKTGSSSSIFSSPLFIRRKRSPLYEALKREFGATKPTSRFVNRQMIQDERVSMKEMMEKMVDRMNELNENFAKCISHEMGVDQELTKKPEEGAKRQIVEENKDSEEEEETEDLEETDATEESEDLEEATEENLEDTEEATEGSEDLENATEENLENVERTLKDATEEPLEESEDLGEAEGTEEPLKDVERILEEDDETEEPTDDLEATEEPLEDEDGEVEGTTEDTEIEDEEEEDEEDLDESNVDSDRSLLEKAMKSNK